MLYDRWCRVVGERGGENALWEVESGRAWTFRQLQELAEATPLAGGLQRVIPRGAGLGFVLEVLRGWRLRATVCPLEEGQAEPCPDEVPTGGVHLKTTSATTGVARHVVFRPNQLVADVDQIVSAMGLDPSRPNLAGISLAHSYGFSNLVLPLLLHGIPLILCGSGLPEAIRRGASLAPQVTLAGVPVLWRSWWEAGAVPPNVSLAISAGAPLPLPLEKAIFAKTAIKVHNFYGATECGGIAYDDSPVPREEESLAGRPLPGVTLRLADGGVLEVQSAAVGEGYWPTPQEDLGQGVYRTADLARIEGERLYLAGRAADLIHVAGRKVSPGTIESVLVKHPDVRDCLVLGIPSDDSIRGEVVVAVVVGDQASERELRQYLGAILPGWQVPRFWHFTESLRPDERGKLSRRIWRDRLSGPAGSLVSA